MTMLTNKKTQIFVACALLLVLCFAATTALATMDECAVGGEMRRSHNCAAVRHTRRDHCCWMKKDGSHGKLPYGCCGTGWATHGCAELIDDICEKHNDDI